MIIRHYTTIIHIQKESCELYDNWVTMITQQSYTFKKNPASCTVWGDNNYTTIMNIQTESSEFYDMGTIKARYKARSFFLQGPYFHATLSQKRLLICSGLRIVATPYQAIHKTAHSRLRCFFLFHYHHPQSPPNTPLFLRFQCPFCYGILVHPMP